MDKEELNINDFNELLKTVNWSYEPYYAECRELMKIMDYKFKKKLQEDNKDERR